MIVKQLVLFSLFNFGYVKCATLKHAGSSCVGPGNVTGTCVSLYKCPSAVITYLLYNSGSKNIPELPEVCSNEYSEPIVCCTDCFIDREEKSRGYTLNRFGELVNLLKGPPAVRACKKYFQELPYTCQGDDRPGVHQYLSDNKTCNEWGLSGAYAVGGRDALKREFPHAALLGYGDSLNSVQWLCGGSVISDKYILTAAHCSSAPAIGSISFAALSVLKRSVQEPWDIYKVKRIIVHPEYKSPSKYHDIALIEVEGSIKFNQDVLPACLDDGNFTWISVQGIGWGRLGNRQPLADNLQVVNLYANENEICSGLFPPHRHLKQGYDAATQMCYGNSYKIVDTCEGDSGGPLQIDYKNCQYTIVGVTSYGKGCGTKDGAGMYTRVQHYTPWIEGIVWPELTRE